MNKITQLRSELAAALARASGLTGLATIPAQPKAGQVWVKPHADRPYVDAKAPGATFKRPALHLQAVFTAPMTPFNTAQEWVDTLVVQLWSAARTDPTLRNLCGGVLIESFTAPGPLDVAGQLMAVELTMSPLLVTLED